MARKLIIGIFISICTIFAMSHNVSAINVNLENYTVSGKFARTALYCEDVNGQVATGNYCAFNVSAPSLVSLDLIRTNRTNGYTVKKGQIVEFYLTVFNLANYPIDGGSAGIRYYLTNGYGDVITLNYEQVDNSDYLDVESFNDTTPDDTDIISQVYSKNKVFRTYKITQLIDKDMTGYQFGFDMTGNNEPVASWYQFENKTLGFSIHDFVIYSPSESKENKEVEEKTQSAVDDSAESGESSQGSVEGSTQNLMSAGASIISALSNAPATDCNINMTTSGSSSAFTGAIGSVNLCSGVPSGVLTMVQGIVALVFTPIVLYYTYSIITTIYKQFREYNS